MIGSFPADAFLLQFLVFGVPIEEVTDEDCSDAQAVTLYVLACGYRDLKAAVDAAQHQMANLLYHPQLGLQCAYRHVSGPPPHWYRVNASWPRSGTPVVWLSQLGQANVKLNHLLLLTPDTHTITHYLTEENMEAMAG